MTGDAPGGPPPSRARRLLRSLWTVRARLTLLYGALFLVSGAGLLAISYVLVDQATAGEAVTVILPDGGVVSTVTEVGRDAPTPSASADTGGGIAGTGAGDRGPQDTQGAHGVVPDPEQVRAIAAEQHADRMSTLLTRSGIALAIMALVSVVLGWFMAGRVLRPLRSITAATRRISAENLHERLALDGPADELSNLGDTIDGLLARLENSFHAQRRFVANASHELRTPLTRQRTVAQVALDDPHPTVESLREAHQRVLAAGRQQEGLIDALLILARSQAGIERRDTIDLGQAGADAVADYREQARTAQVTVTSDLAPAVVPGDRRLVERLVANLVDNAIRYNQPTGTVHLSSAREGNAAVLVVTNTGPTLTEEALGDLTEPFRRAEATRTSRAGHGLGLSIVTAIVEAHGGTLTLAAQASGGLRATVRIPAAPQPSPSAAQPAASAASSSSLG